MINDKFLQSQNDLIEYKLERKIIKTYDEAIQHINLTINELNFENNHTINLNKCDFSQFDVVDYPDSHFCFNSLFHKMGIFEHKNKEITIPYILNCSESIFPSVEFDSIQLMKNINFSYSIFNEEVQIRGCVFNTHIQSIGAIYRKGLTFQGNKLLSDAIDFNMRNCSIKGRFSFINNQFNNLILDLKRVNLIDCEVKFYGCFNEIKLNEAITNISTIIIIEYAEIHKLSISLSTIKGKLYILSKYILNFDANNAIVEGSLFVSDRSIIKSVSDRYTARLLKHESIKMNDVITSNHFKMLEMQKYQIELKNTKRERNRCEYYNEISILKLNSLSNQHGQYWWQGVLFTFAVASIFYFLFALKTKQVDFYLDFSCNSFRQLGLYWKEVLRYLWLPDISGIKEIESGFCSTFIYMLGKIFIAYGIYQTISAFRKYSSNKN